jgi:hypothetical protein
MAIIGLFTVSFYMYAINRREQQQRPPSYLRPRCHHCDITFSEFEWRHRHTDLAGEDVHANCCDSKDCVAIPYERR